MTADFPRQKGLMVNFRAKARREAAIDRIPSEPESGPALAN
jgi:hypothetical protein